MFASPIWGTTQTHVARPIWFFSQTCYPATFRSPQPARSPSIPICLPRAAIPCRKCSTPQKPATSERFWLSAPTPSREPNCLTLAKTFLIVQDLYLTETAALADVVFPAASLYEKSGTVTNTFGDIQIVRKAADRAGVKPDFEGYPLALAEEVCRGCPRNCQASSARQGAFLHDATTTFASGSFVRRFRAPIVSRRFGG